MVKLGKRLFFEKIRIEGLLSRLSTKNLLNNCFVGTLKQKEVDLIKSLTNVSQGLSSVRS